MKKIATHNSATGEKGGGLLSWLVTPFSRCQSKTLIEQYDAGCRYFDLRVRFFDDGRFYFAHGLWKSKVSAIDLIVEFCEHIKQGDKVYLMVTYEGCDPAWKAQNFADVAEFYGEDKVIITTVNEKKPTWRNLFTYEHVEHENAYKVLDGSTWHTYLPIPWLWKTLLYNRPTFNDSVFKFVDFL